jgi:hypothetical protein
MEHRHPGVSRDDLYVIFLRESLLNAREHSVHIARIISGLGRHPYVVYRAAELRVAKVARITAQRTVSFKCKAHKRGMWYSLILKGVIRRIDVDQLLRGISSALTSS